MLSFLMDTSLCFFVLRQYLSPMEGFWLTHVGATTFEVGKPFECFSLLGVLLAINKVFEHFLFRRQFCDWLFVESSSGSSAAVRPIHHPLPVLLCLFLNMHRRLLIDIA